MAFYRQQLSKFEQTKWWFSEQQYTAFLPSSLSPFRRKFDNQFRCYLQELDLLFQLWELLNCKATGLKATAKPNTPSNHSKKLWNYSFGRSVIRHRLVSQNYEFLNTLCAPPAATWETSNQILPIQCIRHCGRTH